jgi:riboflavin synthase
MFTGIVETLGRVRRIEPVRGAARIEIACGLRALAIGESIAVNGACMTVVMKGRGRFAVEVSPESLRRTALGALRPGSPVNLERSLTLSDRLGGHLVQGHVDGVGRVAAVRPEANAWIYTFEAPPAVARYLVEKGSVAVDGVSLTVAASRGRRFDVAVIPHTARHTTLGERKPGDPVNLEADVLAKYVQKLLAGDAGIVRAGTRSARSLRAASKGKGKGGRDGRR